MKKDEQMIDALLQEHADKGTGDDVSFLEDLEKRLDEEGAVTEVIEGNQSKRAGRRTIAGIGIAAAFTIVTAGYYFGRDDYRKAYLELRKNNGGDTATEALTSKKPKDGNEGLGSDSMERDLLSTHSVDDVIKERDDSTTVKVTGQSDQVAQTEVTPSPQSSFKEAIEAIKVDSVHPASNRFLIGNQVFVKGEVFAVSKQGEEFNVQTVSVSSNTIVFKDVDTAETISKNLTEEGKEGMVPSGNTVASFGIHGGLVRPKKIELSMRSRDTFANITGSNQTRGLPAPSPASISPKALQSNRGEEVRYSIDLTPAAKPVSPGALTGRRTQVGGKDAFYDVTPDTRRRKINERYGKLTDNTFKSPWKSPLSTFSVDVDTASYTNMRRMIQSGQSVPKDAVRIEEMINYFNYSYPQPEGEHPFSVNVETASCPWNAEHRLVKVGLQGKDIIKEKRPAANLVFLLDVSGSMNSHDKLPLLVESMKVLLKELNGDDSVSIVVYAGAQGLALPPTLVTEDGRKEILEALNNMRSGGSTNGGAGITLAYKMAKKHFVKGGVNRVILGTDGDFNVGLTDRAALTSMVEREAKSGVYLSVLGFGQGNLNDAMLEDITNKGNGNYSYIDSLREGRKVFLDDMMGNIVTIAKDVKIQVEFNPAKVKSYRLIGYANRLLKAEDFKNKRIDAGEIGAGHTVTALYEIVPGDAQEHVPDVDDLEYQKKRVVEKPVEREVVDSPNMMTVKLAYKGPEATKETESTYFKTHVQDSEKSWEAASEDFKFASGVALFGMLKRDSQHVGEGNYSLVRQLAEKGRGDDTKGHRTEFSDLVRKVVPTAERR